LRWGKKVSRLRGMRNVRRVGLARVGEKAETCEAGNSEEREIGDKAEKGKRGE
jgi:hypothetical protein